jgi:formylglycine-generating enzyme required for sulfatase activity
MKNVRDFSRWVFVGLGVIILTSVSLDAALSPSGISQSALGILASRANPGSECPEGMSQTSVGGHTLCVDQYETSAGEDCEYAVVKNQIESMANIEARSCLPVSQPDRAPWTFVTYHQARELCAKAGKRLPGNEEWYELALGTPDGTPAPCHTEGNTPRSTGATPLCVTPRAVHDAIGNVWEWVDGSVTDGVYNDRPLPESGYVTSADAAGVPDETNEKSADAGFHEDYFWSEETGEFGMIRGGYFGSGSDAGLYSIQAKTPRSFSGNAIGFRCVKDL